MPLVKVTPHTTAVRAALGRVSPSGHSRAVTPGARQAGVAIILAGPQTDPSLCFLRRVERPGDRWSGDVAFPGGWAHPSDGTLSRTAMREAHEEVGIALDDSHHLGDMPVSTIAPGGGQAIGTIGASVFYAGAALPALDHCPREVAQAFWVRSAHLLDANNTMDVTWGRSMMPGIAFESHVIWGLTYRILMDFFDVVHEEFRQNSVS